MTHLGLIDWSFRLTSIWPLCPLPKRSIGENIRAPLKKCPYLENFRKMFWLMGMFRISCQHLGRHKSFHLISRNSFGTPGTPSLEVPEPIQKQGGSSGNNYLWFSLCLELKRVNSTSLSLNSSAYSGFNWKFHPLPSITTNDSLCKAVSESIISWTGTSFGCITESWSFQLL